MSLSSGFWSSALWSALFANGYTGAQALLIRRRMAHDSRNCAKGEREGEAEGRDERQDNKGKGRRMTETMKTTTTTTMRHAPAA